MTLQIFDDIEQGSGEWLQARCGILTASVIGQLITPTMKIADNETSRGLARTLATERIVGKPEYSYPTRAMQRGTDDEPVARSEYATAYSPVEEVGFMVRDFGSYKIGYSPDGLVADDGLIEIKSREPKIHLKTILDGHPPADNLGQLYAGLLVSGRKWIDYLSYCPEMKLWPHRVEPNEDWFAALKGAAEQLENTIAGMVREYESATLLLTTSPARIDIEDLVF